jgi:hypothetical protein
MFHEFEPGLAINLDEVQTVRRVIAGDGTESGCNVTLRGGGFVPLVTTYDSVMATLRAKELQNTYPRGITVSSTPPTMNADISSG